MGESQTGDESLEMALGAGTRPPVGRYRLDLPSGRWAWSDEIYEMHGFSPGEVVPSTELLVAHKHPDDRRRIDHVLKEAEASGEPFSSVHRIRDARGDVRMLAITGQGRKDPDSGEVTELFGYFIDVTQANREVAQREATASIQASAERRATIEQAKGVLMVGYGVDAEDSFGRLATASNQLNVPVRDLAHWLLVWFSRSGGTAPTGEELAEFLAAPVPAQPDPSRPSDLPENAA